ncbi:MAG TPA: hypothetical protein VFJ93_11390 [Gaiellaceae bacterium]|nr:hypothetical protein [Gaiellaceae bacterium]
MHSFRRAREVPFFGDSDEVLQLPKLHCAPLLLNPIDRFEAAEQSEAHDHLPPANPTEVTGKLPARPTTGARGHTELEERAVNGVIAAVAAAA